MDAVCWIFGGSHRHVPVFRVGSASGVCACGMSGGHHDPCLGRDLHRIETLEVDHTNGREDCRLHRDDAGGKAIVGLLPGALEFRGQTRRQPSCLLIFDESIESLPPTSSFAFKLKAMKLSDAKLHLQAKSIAANRTKTAANRLWERRPDVGWKSLGQTV